MRKEIDILIQAAERSCAVVEKDTNVLWTREDLIEGREAGRYKGEGRLLPPDGQIEVSGPFPGCLQQGGSLRGPSYRPIGQTAHFVIFAPEPGEVAKPPRDGT